MKLKTLLLVTCIAGLLVASPAFPKKPPHTPLPAPTNFTANPRSGYIVFSWDTVGTAEKYSVCVEGEVTWSDGLVRRQVDFEWDFNTMDEIGTTGTTNGRTYLAIPETAFVRIALALIEDSGYDRSLVVGLLLEADGKVKAMNPPPGPQNHPFSDTDDFEVLWMRPT